MSMEGLPKEQQDKVDQMMIDKMFNKEEDPDFALDEETVRTMGTPQ